MSKVVNPCARCVDNEGVVVISMSFHEVHLCQSCYNLFLATDATKAFSNEFGFGCQICPEDRVGFNFINIRGETKRVCDDCLSDVAKELGVE